MNIRVSASPATAYEVAALTQGYGLDLDDFVRSCLHFARLFLLTSGPTEQEQGAEVAHADVATDLLMAALPFWDMAEELNRLSALLEDAIVDLRGKRLQVEAMRCSEGREIVSETRRFARSRETTIVYEQSEAFVGGATLELLKKVRDLGYYGQTSVFDNRALDLNRPGEKPLDRQLGCTISTADMLQWFPALRRYGFLHPQVPQAACNSDDGGGQVSDAMSKLLAQLVEVICFLLRQNHELPGDDFRQDLMIIHGRAKRIASAWSEQLLAAEAGLHMLSGAAELIAEKSLILASGVGAGRPILADEKALPAVRDNRRVAQARPGDAKSQAAVRDGMNWYEREVF